MSVAKTWNAFVGTPRLTTDYSYTGNTLTGGKTVVWLPMTAENGRRVADKMTPAGARELAAQLLRLVDEADERNSSL